METSHFPNLRRDGPGEVVDVEVEIGEVGEVPNLLGYLPREGVVVEVEAGEAPELGHGGGDGSGEPAPLERDVRHFAVLVARHPLELSAAAAGVAVAGPGAQHAALGVQRRLERHERAHLRVAPREGDEGKDDDEEEGEGEWGGTHVLLWGNRRGEGERGGGEKKKKGGFFISLCSTVHTQK